MQKFSVEKLDRNDYPQVINIWSESYQFSISDELMRKDANLYRTAQSLGFSVPYPLGAILCKAESDVNFVITPGLDVYKCYLLVGNESERIGKIVDGL